MIKKIVMTMMLILNIISFSNEVPHTYIYDNPEKAITTAETLKKKPNGAEMNISVTKIKSKEINGEIDPIKRLINFKFDKKINDILISDKPILKVNNYEYTVDDKNLIVKYEKIPQVLYMKINKEVYKFDLKKEVKNFYANKYPKSTFDSQYTFEVDSTFKNGIITFLDGGGVSLPQGVKLKNRNGKGFVAGSHGSHFHERRIENVKVKESNGEWGMDNIINTSKISAKADIQSKYINNPSNVECIYTINSIKGDTILNYSYEIGEYYTNDPGAGGDLIYQGSEYYNIKIIFEKKQEQVFADNEITFEIDDTYDGSFIKNLSSGEIRFNYGTVTSKGLKNITNDNKRKFESIQDHEYGLSGITLRKIVYLDKFFLNSENITLSNKKEYPSKTVSVNEVLVQTENYQDTFTKDSEFMFSLKKYPKNDFSLLFKAEGRGKKFIPGTGEEYDLNSIITTKVNFKYIVKTFIGSSNLTFDQNYNKSFINFNADNNGNPLGIENSVQGLTFGTTGKGISVMQQGDILEINGVQNQIGASGNLGETQGSIGTLGYKYKAENGKLRLALTNWGVLEPSRTFEVKVLKGGAEAVRHTFTIQAPKRVEGTSRVKFVETYPNTQFVAFNGVSLNSPTALSLENSVTGVTLESSTGAGLVTMQQGDILDINGVQVTVGASGNLSERSLSLGSLTLNYKLENGKLRIRPISWGVQEPLREATIRIIRGANEISIHTLNIKSPIKVEGNSRLTLREYYSINDYIAFNGVSLDNPLSLALENSLRDVTLESSTGAGIVTMLQGDILDINGVQNQIGASGNLGEKETTIDTLRFAYKVEAGKLRVKVLDWGVLEPRRDIRIKVKRGTNEISIHTLNIKSPTKVEGDTSLKFDNTYQIRSSLRFNAINLDSFIGKLTMNNQTGVTLESTNGSGIPFMNQGDKIYISDNFTTRRNRRSAFTNNYYEIGVSGTLAKQNIKLTNGEVGVQVEGGKLNLALNNWTVNKNVNVRVQIVRGTNQIMDHTFTLKAPDAPFNIISQGILDFGTIIAGAKNRTAETDVKIEMIKDVTDIQFKLNTDSPELYNKNGTTLRARNIQALVSQQANRRYLVKIQGKLDVPENQELGEYSGSLILEMKIK